MQRLAELDGKYVVVSNQMDAAISADDIFYESKFGDNDYLFNWLEEKGFLRIWQSIRPALKRNSGVPPEYLNGVFAAMILSHLKAIQDTDQMSADGRLMFKLGFNPGRGGSLCTFRLPNRQHHS
jgi:hypothetical protein